MTHDKPLTYKDAGVDIDAGNELVRRIRPLVDATRRPEVLGGLGGFGGLFALEPGRYRQPVLVAGTDGVGTKLKLAIELGRCETVGIDLVAMCANDVIVQGAEPLFFLDYYATGRLDVDVGVAVMNGIAEGCRQAGAALLGGETAEMPGMYRDGDFDLAGFCVGIVERDRLIDGSAARPGHRLLGLASSGPHSNGYSLIRSVLRRTPGGAGAAWGDGGTIGDALLAPTRIYARAILRLLNEIAVGAIAHVTGGGLVENLARVLPDNVDALVDPTGWTRPSVFDWLQEHGSIAGPEMLRTFNCGVGMVIAVRPSDEQRARQILESSGETVFALGRIEAGTGRVHFNE